MRSARGIAGILVGTVALGLLVGGPAAAESESPSASTEASEAPSEVAPPAPSGDGQLRIGTMTTLTGDSAASGRAIVAAVELAAREINDAGGVAGKPVLTYHRSTTGADAARIAAITEALAAKGVDVIVGPNSIAQLEAATPAAGAAGVLMISPAITAPEFSDLEGASLARTIPGAGLQGAAVAGLIGPGATVAIVGPDDSTTVAIRAQLKRELGIKRGSIVLSSTVSAEAADPAAAVEEVLALGADAVFVSMPRSAREATAGIVAGLIDAGTDPSAVFLSTAALGDYSASSHAASFAGVRGVLAQQSLSENFAARLSEADPLVTSIGRAAEAYDAVIAAALAATLAGDEGGASVSYFLPAATGEGIPCASWGECLAVLETEPDIDYDGQAGPLGLDAIGDVRSADYGISEYGGDGRSETTDTQRIG